MEIAFEGDVTHEHMRQAYALHFRPSRASAAARLVIAVVAGLGLACVIVRTAVDCVCWASFPWVPASVLLALAGVVALSPWWLPRYLASQQKKTGGYRTGRASGIVSAEGIRWVGEHSEGRMAWPGYVKHRRSADLVLLYTLPTVIAVYPRALFRSDPDWQAFGELVSQKVPEARQLRRPLRPGVALLIALAAVAVIALLINLLLPAGVCPRTWGG